MLSLMNRAVGRVVARGDGGNPFAEGSRASGIRQWAALQITSLVRLPGKQSRHPASQRSEKRSIGCSFMPTPPQSRQHFAGSRFPAQSRQRKPTILTLRWWSETAGCAVKWQKGNRDRRLCSPTAECQTNLFLPVSSAVSVRCNVACEMEAVQKWPISRLLPRPRRQAEPRAVMPMSCPCEASRAIAGPLAGRSLAAIF